MIKIIRNILQSFIDRIDAGNSNISEDEQLQIIELLGNINREELSKSESADYLGVSKSTFDNYVRKGLLPEGKKRRGFNELSWNKKDLYDFNVRR